jgi:hypothetical protein
MKDLKKYSNINQVKKNWETYKNKNVEGEIKPSTRKDKKYMITVDGKTVHFGGNYEDFTKHKDKDRQARYLKRATNIKGDWKQNKYSPNNLAINLLWK